MRTIEIEVSDANYEKVKDLLEHLTYVESVRVSYAEGSFALSGQIDEGTIRDTVRSEKRQEEPIKAKMYGGGIASMPQLTKESISDAILTTPSPSENLGSAESNESVGSAESVGTPKRRVDTITLMSEESFAEEWDSEEDDRYDEMYRKRDLEDEVQKR